MSGERDLVGVVINGRYRVERRLGTGGMGSVWRVRHVQSLQRYALKTLHARSAKDRMAVDRFLREARAAAALSSKHVVKIVDADVNHVDPESGEPMPFIVMELLQGSTLEAVVSWFGPLPPAKLVWVMEQMGRALDLAHEKGIIHRDLKPENVFIAIDEDGDTLAKVCDFGIAKMRGSSATDLMSTGAMKTEVGTTIGTPMYMAPEQARNSTSVVVESDQWAVALIAFRCLTGQEYFSGATSTADLLLKIVNDPIEPPSSRVSTMTREFDAWFLRSCDRVPSKRWSSVGEQVAALRESLGVSSVSKIDVVPDAESIEVAPTVRVDDSGSDRASTDANSARTEDAPSSAAAVTRKRIAPVAWWAGGMIVIVLISAGVISRMRVPAPVSESASTPAPLPVPQSTAQHAVAPPTPVASSPPSASVASSASTAPTIVKSPPTVVHKPSVVPVASSAVVTALPTAEPPKVPPSKLAKGSGCERGADCMSGICAAYTCQ